MPAFYPRSHQASSHPLTPPDSGSGYGYSSMHYPQDSFVPHQGMGPARHDSAYDYQQHNYMQPSVAPAPPSYQYQSGGFQPTTSLPPISSYYEPMGAPILPPLRMQDHISFSEDYQRRVQQQQEQQNAALREQQRQAAKEEKATGGVSAKLDYEMDRMTDFVTHYTQKIFNQQVTSQPSFRKWVHAVLSATRLPSATILLSLHYLSERFRLHPESIPSGENQIYRLLAVSLILGSKFLDDNTFVNKSWSDVTSIRVKELNALEMKWLSLISYHLHVELDSGLQSWLDAWKTYNEEQIAKQQAATRLSPLDTNVHRHSSNRDRYSPYPTPYSTSTARSYGTPTSSRSSQYVSTPYSSADPWSSTDRSSYDDPYKRQHRYPTLNDIDEANRRASEERSQAHAMYHNYQLPSISNSYYQPTGYNSAWDAYGWNNMHRSGCTCATCAYQHHYRPYPMASSYTAQTVMG
ncbi:hypothetical protein WHR41_08266 [Cladosporium halotolerans]|uniref:Uncharacterized protein n=1 Tax=Cladosporium halotolerans TaxID=1052096 RepID=A0AB34KIE9_9PEZI